jgi:hypothetical protein
MVQSDAPLTSPKNHDEHVSKALQLARDKQSIAKAIKYLKERGVLSDSAHDVASFLCFHKKRGEFDEVSLGDYIGEGDTPFKSDVRMCYVRMCDNDFKGMTFQEVCP